MNLKILNYNFNDVLTDNDILYVKDVIKKEEVDKLIAGQGTPKYVVSDVYYTYPETDWHGASFSLVDYAFVLDGVKTPAPSKQSCFNFIINKKMVHRYLCLKLVEFFNFKNYNYTWSGAGKEFDMSSTLLEIDSVDSKSPIHDVRNYLLSPVTHLPRIIHFPKMTITNYAILNYGENRWTWENGLDNLFSGSAVSVITESVSTQLASALTEKTLYATLGLTFPLWVGGYGHASHWKSMGYDIFEDVIDHNYQHMPTLIERCYWAFALNKEILSDIDLAHNLRSTHMDRLVKNKEMLETEKCLPALVAKLKTWPSEAQKIVPLIAKGFANLNQINFNLQSP